MMAKTSTKYISLIILFALIKKKEKETKTSTVGAESDTSKMIEH